MEALKETDLELTMELDWGLDCPLDKPNQS
jgi:hypothetical protein